MGTKESCFLTSRARSLVRCSVLQKARRGCCFQERGHRAILFKLILAANYLNIKNLFDLTCQTVADMIKGEEIRTGPSTSITTLHLRRKRRCVGRTNRLLNDVWEMSLKQINQFIALCCFLFLCVWSVWMMSWSLFFFSIFMTMFDLHVLLFYHYEPMVGMFF